MIPPEIRRSVLLQKAIKLALAGTLLTFASFSATAADPSSDTETPQPPDILLGPLFNDVQNAKLLPDQKTFADAIPNSDPLMILADYRMQRNQSGFDLRHFVDVNFTLPKAGEKYVPPAGQSLREHIDGLWPVLTRSTKNVKKWDSLLPLPESYVVPGGRFREIYYWDSYFTMLGLAESGHWDKVADMVANFGYEIDAWGHIPNGNRTYYLSRSQPPFFAFMVELLAQHEGDDALKEYLPQLQKEYAYWMEGVETLQPGQQTNASSNWRTAAFSTATGTIGIRPALNPGLKISLPPKATPTARQRRSIGTSDLPPPPAGISAPAGWIIRSSSVPFVPPRLSLSILTLCCISWRRPSPAPALRRAIGPKPRNMTRWPTRGKKPLKCICGITKRVGMPTTICRTIKSVTNSPLPHCSRSM